MYDFAACIPPPNAPLIGCSCVSDCYCTRDYAWLCGFGCLPVVCVCVIVVCCCVFMLANLVARPPVLPMVVACTHGWLYWYVPVCLLLCCQYDDMMHVFPYVAYSTPIPMYACIYVGLSLCVCATLLVFVFVSPCANMGVLMYAGVQCIWTRIHVVFMPAVHCCLCCCSHDCLHRSMVARMDHYSKNKHGTCIIVVHIPPSLCVCCAVYMMACMRSMHVMLVV